MVNRRIKYNIPSYGRASDIVSGFTKTDKWLRSLVANITGNGEYADGLDWRGLLSEGYKIRGIAQKMLASRPGRNAGLEQKTEQPYQPTQRAPDALPRPGMLF